MREIKFRGIAIVNYGRYKKGDWVYGGYTKTGDGEAHYITWIETSMFYDGMRDTPMMLKVNPKTIGQYTGLKDKNGKEIYEGDIVEYNWNTNIEWIKERITILDFIDDTHKLKKFMKFPLEAKDFVVIGNIYQNPELIKNED